MVFSPSNDVELKTAIDKWYSLANDGSTNALENANNYDGYEYQGNPNTWNVTAITDMSYLFAFKGIDYTNHPDISTWITSNVTNMYGTFYDSTFNQPIGNWDVGNVTNMKWMFRRATTFNQPIGNWDVSNVTTMYGMFLASHFNQPIGDWDVSNVADMSFSFQQSEFNQPIGNWDVSNVTTMYGMFIDAHFNQPIGNWDVSNVTNMGEMFYGSAFNQSLANWERTGSTVGNVTSMALMFANADHFNGDIGNWDLGRVGYTEGMFYGALAFNQPIGNWDVSAVGAMNNMFRGAASFNQDIGNWDTSNVSYMNDMFNSSDFNQNINTKTVTVNGKTYVAWDVSKVLGMNGMFTYAKKFNQPIGNWDTSNVTSMIQMFCNNSVFNQSIENWDVSKVQDMTKMFFMNTGFNQPIGNWDVSSVTKMNQMFESSIYNQFINWNSSSLEEMISMFVDSVFNQPINLNTSKVGYAISVFYGASKFNQDINTKMVTTASGTSFLAWDMSSVGDMSYMFQGAKEFNQPIGNWNTISVTLMVTVFGGAESFNQPLTKQSVTINGNTYVAWDTSSVTNMSTMFLTAFAFNQPLDSWDVSNVENMFAMFFKAAAFNQPIGSWVVSNVTNMEQIFYEATSFNNGGSSDISNWDTSNVTNMSYMFFYCPFNQDIKTKEVTVNGQTYTSWDVSKVTNMSLMFRGDKKFNQDIRQWSVDTNCNTTNMFLLAEEMKVLYEGTDLFHVSPSPDTFFNLGYIPPTITILGDNPMNVEVNTTYNDPGATGTNSDGDDLTSNITSNIGDLNTSVLENFTLIYNLTHSVDGVDQVALPRSRLIVVQDKSRPVITLLGLENITITVNHSGGYIDAGATASDNYDGNITDNIVRVDPVVISEIGKYTVTYNVTDTAGNKAYPVTRTVNVVDTPPTITLNGNSPVYIDIDQPYVDDGAGATDALDGDLTNDIKIYTGDINVKKIGTYQVTYNVTNSVGLSAITVYRTVIVQDPFYPTISLNGITPIKIEKNSTYNDAGATAVDKIYGDITSDIDTNLSNLDTNVVGQFIVTYNVTNEQGNKADEVTRLINIVESPPVITLNGSSSITIDIGTTYVDPGATAIDVLDNDITSDIDTNLPGGVDISKQGKYLVTYNVNDSIGVAAKQVTRNVIIADPYFPTIVLNGVTPIKIQNFSKYVDAGATATDHVDGNITDKMVTVNKVNSDIVGTYTVVYKVTDNEGNSSTATRFVNVVNDPPVITLVGNNQVSIDYGETYTDAGAVASDSIDGDLSNDIVTNIPSGGIDTTNIGPFIITYNVKDQYGLVAKEVKRTVNVIDPYFPTISLNGVTPLKVELGSTYVDAGATATDKIDGIITSKIITTTNVNTSIVGSYSVVYKVTDNEENSTTETRSVIVVDDPPVITLKGDNPVIVNYDQTYTDAGATAGDSIDGDLTDDIVTNIQDFNTQTIGPFTLTYNVTDDAGNSAEEVTRTIIVHDPYPPTITLLGITPINVEKGSTYVDAGATANDVVDGDLTSNIISNEDDFSTENVGQFTVTYNVSDAEGNKAIQSTRTINVVDVPPVITLVGDKQITIDYGDIFTDPGATASDYVDGDLTADIETNIQDLDTTAIGSFILTYNVTDDAGISAEEVTRTIIVHDQFNPVITMLGKTPIDIELYSKYTTLLDAGSTAYDKIDGNITSSILTNIPEGGLDTSVVGTYNVTYNVTDEEGNSAPTVTRTVNVIYAPPVITLLGENSVTFECKSSIPYQDAGAIASNPIDGDLTSSITSNIANFDPNLVTQFIVRYNVSDEYGNAAEEVTRTVNIVDTVKPGIILNGVTPVKIEINSTYDDDGATAYDIVWGDLTPTIKITDPVNTAIPGTYTVTYSSTDDSNNTYTAFRTVIVEDSRPTITLNGTSPVTIDIGDVYNDDGATAGDSIDGDLTSNIVTHDPVNTQIPGTYTITYNVKDAAGNSGDQVTRTVIVHDQYVPVITLKGITPVTIERYSLYNDVGATAYDKIDGDITQKIKTTGIPINTDVVGNYLISYNVTDAEGNKAKTVTRRVNVVDVPPVITLNGDPIISIDYNTTYNDEGATASDYVDGNLTSQIVTYNPVNTQIPGTYIVTYNVRDVSGITAEQITRTVTVIDQYYPVIVLLGETPITIEQNSTYVDAGATATDKVYGGLTSDIVVTNPVNTSKVGKYIITYNVTNEADNKAKTVTRTVNVVNVPPVITLIGEHSVTVDWDKTYVDAGASASDYVDGDLTPSIVIYNPVNTSVPGTYSVTYNVKDAVGIFAIQVTRTVIVHDPNIPTIVLLGQTPITVEINSTYIDHGANAFDQLDGDISNEIVTVNTVDTSKVGTYDITYNVTDSVGNKGKTVNRKVYVVDVEPVIKLNGESIVTVDYGITYIDGGATAYDYVDGDLTSQIVTYNPVNTQNPGTYIVTYNVRDASGLAAKEASRTVIVHDPYIPTIVLLGETPVTIEQSSTYIDTGATALDKLYGDITADIVVTNPVNTSKVGKYIITYNVTNEADNKAKTVTRTVNVVNVPPVITLIGENSVTVDWGKSYVDAGASASDYVDGDLTSQIVTYNSVNTQNPGIYYVTYNVKDAAGIRATQVTRSVIVHDPYNPTIIGLGQTPITVEINSSYVDPGANAFDQLDGDITGQIVTINTVDTSKVGTYSVTYNVTDSLGNKAKTVTRKVYVVDIEPVIKLNGESIVTIDYGIEYIDDGATAYDRVDGDLTSQIITYNPVNIDKPGIYTVTYNVTDKSGIRAKEVTRQVAIHDEYIPVIILLGDSRTIVELGDQYIDDGAEAHDHVEGDITAQIQITSNLNISKVGSYSVLYNVTDLEGKKAKTVIRIVIVQETLEIPSLGGPFQGFSAKQTIGNYKGGEQASTRSILRRGWNTSYALGRVNGQDRVTTPFRAVNNAGDFLSRQNYKCGGPTGMSKSSIGWAGSKIYLGSQINNCDNTGVEGSSGNVKYVYDSSDYITFRKQQATNSNYNDLKNGGDDHNASYVPLKHVRI